MLCAAARFFSRRKIQLQQDVAGVLDHSALPQHKRRWTNSCSKEPCQPKWKLPPRIHSCEDVQPSPLPHNTIYTAGTAHRAPGPSRSPAITRQQGGRESTAQMLRPLLHTPPRGLLTHTRPDVVDPGWAEKIHGVKFRFAYFRMLYKKKKNMKGNKNGSEKQDLVWRQWLPEEGKVILRSSVWNLVTSSESDCNLWITQTGQWV